MKSALAIAISFLVGLVSLDLAHAGAFAQCTGCHNGRSAPDIRDKYRTVEEFVRAAKMTKDVRMQVYRNNEQLLREAAKDIGLK